MFPPSQNTTHRPRKNEYLTLTLLSAQVKGQRLSSIQNQYWRKGRHCTLLVGWLGLAVAHVEAWTMTLQRDKDFCSRYEKRFGLDFSLREGKPCADKLRLLTELRLEKGSFDNLRLHGAANTPVSMDSSALAHQLIDRRRGGLCFELNCLFAELCLRWDTGFPSYLQR